MEFIDLKKQYAVLKTQIDTGIQNVLDNAQFISGPQVEQLAQELAVYCGTDFCLPCANGTDALTLALRTLNIGEGDIVLLPTFTFFATAETVSLEKAIPIFIDIDERTFNIAPQKIEQAVQKLANQGKKAKAIVTVDLFGLPADYEAVCAVAKKHGLLIIEDAAQGFGGSINGKKAGSFGDIATTSFFPAKPLGCYGDGGAIFTNNKTHYDFLKSIAVHGKGGDKYDNVRIGYNSRLDTLQAAILLPKLHAFKDYELEKRQEIAAEYTKALKDIVKVPYIPQGYISSYAQYTLTLESGNQRNLVQQKLSEEGIPTMIYYPKCMHQQTAYKDYSFNIEDLTTAESLTQRALSIPMHPYLEKTDIQKIIEAIKRSIS